MSSQVTKDNPNAESSSKDTASSNPLLIKAKLGHTATTKPTVTVEANQSGPETAQKDFSVDYDIPTLDDIALPGEKVPPLRTKTGSTSGSSFGTTSGTTSGTKMESTPGTTLGTNSTIPVPKHILNAGLTSHTNNQGFSPEFIDKLAADLQEILIPEIEKSINFAFNNALATAMDQASKITKSTINKRIRDLIPELLKQHLQNVSKNDLL